MYLPQEDISPLNASHTDMCRFSGPTDEKFQKVSGKLQDLARKIVA